MARGAARTLDLKPVDVAAAPGSVWAKMRFDRRALQPGPLALLTVHNVDRFAVLVNGVEVFRNFDSPSEGVEGFYQPVEIRIPDAVIRPGVNDILVHVSAERGLAVGRYEIGVAPDIARDYKYLYFWRISAAWAATMGIVAITALVTLLWLMRRRESELLFLMLYGVTCALDNANLLSSHYLVSYRVFYAIQNGIIYFEMAAALSYCLVFFGHPGAIRIARRLFAASLACAAIQIALAGRPLAFVAVNAVALAIVLLVCVEIHRRRAVARSNDAILFLLVFCLFIVGSIHDIGMDPSVDGWRGLGFYTAPYYGFIFTSVFLYTLARRASHAFGALETANQTLQDRVEQTRRDLLASEARRRELEVASAIETERERVMREIHDGIGANLVGALSAARGKDASGIAVRTLERALLDLKMTVDSLEPVGGDVAALLGNFRHRIETDLRESGVACRWTADACRPLAWLDAPNALHLLRIYQEAFGNILLHAGARAIAFGCREESRDGRPGVLTFVEDDGRGFCVDAPGGGGHGLRNMQARATSIHAELSLTSTPGAGVRITVWLPYER